jgi:hypothetical protein
MMPKVHPCVCGFTCESYSQMKRHRVKCVAWAARPDRYGLMTERRRQSHLDRFGLDPHPQAALCAHCGKRADHHDPACPDSYHEMVRRSALAKHGIDPRQFEVFLRVLAKRYEGAS